MSELRDLEQFLLKLIARGERKAELGFEGVARWATRWWGVAELRVQLGSPPDEIAEAIDWMVKLDTVRFCGKVGDRVPSGSGEVRLRESVRRGFFSP